jgi:amidase
MQIIRRNQVIYQFDPKNQPVASVEPGETILLETDDCFGSQLESESDLITSVDFNKVNPATGPLAIKGASAGDVLCVDILDIKLGEKGFMVAIPGEGAFAERLKEPVTKMITVSKDRFLFDQDLSFPIHPMIGVIGVAPSEGTMGCGEIGDHGGNMDAKVICPGARIYFLVRQEGAMLAMGDCHAGMGDGESLICGVEITAEVKVKVDLIKSPNFKPPRPIVELEDKFITIGNGESLDTAASTALMDMLNLIQEKTGKSEAEIAMLISAVGDLKVCQIVDPQKTARVEMPKAILKDLQQPVLP